MSQGAVLSHYYKTFSGTDTIAFLAFPGIKPICIGSLTTISYSMFRNKVPVINIGRTNINGITRGSRIYAGTMVFTLINKHWLRELQEEAGYLSKYPTLKVDELPLFDIMIVSANEYGNSVSMFIYGIDFTDESQTISIEDLFTENVFKFVARDLSVFDEVSTSGTYKKQKTQRLGNISSNTINQEEIRFQENTPIFLSDKDKQKTLARSLYYNTTELMGEDIGVIQKLINQFYPQLNLPVTYKYDKGTERAVKKFQEDNGLEVNGVVDNYTYNVLLGVAGGNDNKYAQVINKSGAYVHYRPNQASMIVETIPYLSQVEILGIETTDQNYYQTQNGYISQYDLYTLDTNYNSYELSTISLNDEGAQVAILQQALNITPTGIFDIQTEDALKKYQSENDLLENGICDYVTWNSIISNTDISGKIYNNISVIYSKNCGTYNLYDKDELNKYRISIKNDNNINIKVSAVAIYDNNNTYTKSISKTGTDININLSELDSILKYNIKYGYPKEVEFVVYPFNGESYKWYFYYKKGI